MIRRGRRLLPVVVLTGLFAQACGGDTPSAPSVLVEPVDLAVPWARAEAADLGFDVRALDAAFDAAADLDALRALVVVRRGRLVREAYFRGTTADTALDVRSVTKTVTALLVGLASDDGLLDVDDPISDWLDSDALTPAHDAIRVRHLLTMTSGIQWSDEGDFVPWFYSGRPVDYVLELPVVAAPDERFIYNTGGSHLLSVIVRSATGASALGFAHDRLFAPLGMRNAYWFTFEGTGDPMGGAALALRARDLAKVGQLVLQGGRSGDDRLLSEAWMEEAFREHVRLGPAGSGVLDEGGYGFQVWTESDAPEAFVMWGFGGQFVWVVPELELVVVAASEWRGRTYPEARAQASAAAGLIREMVIPSAR